MSLLDRKRDAYYRYTQERLLREMKQEKEVTKEVFKKMYFRYATPNSGWTEDYWNHFYEKEEGKRYFFSEPQTPESTQMFIITDNINRRIVFLTEEAEESFFDFPGKD